MSNSIASDLVRWVRKNRVHKYRHDMTRKNNELVAQVSAEHAKEIETILRKHFAKSTIDGYWKNSKTSKAGWQDVQVRAHTQKYELLRAYVEAGDDGLTNYEAGRNAHMLKSCYWKRCGELKRAGYIAANGEERINLTSGSKQAVCVITPQGRKKYDDAS